MILLKNAAILDDGHLYDVRDVLTDGETIRAVDTGIADDAAEVVYDLQGKTLLPGMFNNHLHLVDPDGRPEKTFVQSDLEEFAQNGILAVRDMGIDQKHRSYEDYVKWKAEMDSPEHPELFTYGYFQRVFKQVFGPPPGMEDGGPGGGAGPAPKGPPPQPQPYHETPEAAAAAVEEAHRYGCCGIKIHGIQRSDEAAERIRAIVETANKYDMYVAAHINGYDECSVLMDCGAHEAAHIAMDLTPLDVVDRMAEYGFVVTPTVANYKRMDRDGFFPNNGFESVLKNIENYYKAGIKLTVGTDYMGTPEPPYVDTAIPVMEMALMASCGMPVQEVIRGATIYAAETCHADSRMGTIEAGKLANLIVVDGRVDETFEIFHNVPFVMNRGKIIKDQF